jgi:hypothetical protein
MEEQKRTYYVSIASGEILEQAAEPEGQFKIRATDEEVKHLKEFMVENYKADWDSFWEAHVPFKEYHTNKTNPEYDNTMKEMYAMLYELGDEATKQHISSMGYVGSDNLD